MLKFNSASQAWEPGDPQVNTLTTDKWCKANSSGQIDCTSDTPPSGAFTAGSGVAYYTGGNVAVGTPLRRLTWMSAVE